MSKNRSTDQYYLIVGMGATGFSIAQYLLNKGKHFHVFDTRASSLMLEEFDQAFPNAEKYFEHIDDEVLFGAEEIYLSPGVPRDDPTVAKAIDRGISVVGDVALFLREVHKPIIGITGSNGKSTVTTMVGLAAKAAGINVAVGGNIGVPALALLENDADLYVLELSSFQLESTKVPALDVACHLNISADHMDRYDSLSHYVMAKHIIFEGAQRVVFNIDDPNTRPPVLKNTQRYGFGLNIGLDKEELQYTFCPESGWLTAEGEQLIFKDDIKVKGVHNVKNALALYAIADAAGIARSACHKVLREFPGLSHRCEFVFTENGVSFINDSKATNVGAAEAAIRGLAPEFASLILIAGGEGKGAEFGELAKQINQSVRVLILIGKDADQIAKGVSITTVRAENMSDAVAVAKQHAQSGDAVLLSPACASFDMYGSFEERGEDFCQCVKGGASVC